MAQQRTVVGFFDNIGEAQQAVQLLLAGGFTPANMMLSTPTDLKTGAGNGATLPTKVDSSSGRFFSSLFGTKDENQPASPNFTTQSGTLLTVQAQSPAETKQVTNLMDLAGAGDVSVNERTDLTT